MKCFSPINTIRQGSSESSTSGSPIQAQRGEQAQQVEQAQQGEQTDWLTLPGDIRVEIARRLDRTARANLRLVCEAFKAAVNEVVTDVTRWEALQR